MRTRSLDLAADRAMPGMNGARSHEALFDAFPQLKDLAPVACDAFLARTVRRTLDPRQVLVTSGSECSHLPLVLAGTLRVFMPSDTGRELTLYRIERGESCILSATCILNGGRFPAVAEAEGAADVLLVPAPVFARLVEEQPEWRRFVFDLYARRLVHVLALVEEVAFQRMDERLASYLLEHARGAGPVVQETHARIAAELGTSREVVTRILADFESRGLVELDRGRIEVRKADELRARAISPPR
ncbi:MAG: Crp/Fnr family transcriptional regulator [Spirochaetes bacterium]|nr:Crp/Fnr family transcriptional regulator [Spirochaetota bacterium]